MGLSARTNNFNLLRLLFAIWVLLAHSPEIVDGNRSREILSRFGSVLSFGDLAVDGFFLLSGYLILQSWTRQPQAWQFLKKRILRIYPAFLVATLVCIFIVGPLGTLDRADYFSRLNLHALAIEALHLLTPTLPPVFLGTYYANANIPMWSISREFCCYLIVLGLGMVGALRYRFGWLLLTAVVFTRFVYLKYLYIDVGEMRVVILFLCGGCFYLYRDRVRFSGWAALMMLPFLAVALHSGRAAEVAVCTAGAYVLFYVGGKRLDGLSKFNRLPDVSYGVYLYGWPIQKLLTWYVPSISPWALFAATTLFAMLAGLASWKLIEKPALRLKARSHIPMTAQAGSVAS